jgi:iron(III) transport system ATP-binding protein
MKLVSIRGVHKRFDEVKVLGGIDLDLDEGEVVALLGPSGCGKTTLLRILAGLEEPDAGEVHLGGVQVAGASASVPPEQRRVGLVFQDYALFPHLTVEQNVGFGLRRLEAGERRARVQRALERVDVTALAGRYPHELSGGQQQRVALARALAPSPRLLLLDEPFSNLDASLRRRLRVELRELLGQLGVGAIFVTHDQDEALSLAARVAVMDRGAIVQIGAPRELYRRPATVAVARAVGPTNVLPGRASGGVVHCALGDLPGEGPDGEVFVIVRPESLVLGAEGVPARIVGRDYVGREEIAFALVDDDAEPLACCVDGAAELEEPCSVRLLGPAHWVRG